MNDLTLYPADIMAMSVNQLATLPTHQLFEIDTNLDQLIEWAKKARSKLDAAKEQRYGDRARAALRESGRDFGTVHFSDGPLRIKFELSKKVTWHPVELKTIAERITASGENVDDYLDIRLSVPESRFTHWPPSLQQQFAAARTVEPGKPSFRLTLTSENQA